jgi:hypothetical protein
VDWEDQVLDLGLSSGEQEEAEDIGAKFLLPNLLRMRS